MAEFFSTNLKYLREQKGLSQNKLGNMIGVNQTTIARWEDDNRIPTIDNAIDVAEALNINLIDLLSKDLRFDNENEYDEQIKKISTNNGVEISYAKERPITAEDVLDVNKVLMEEINKGKE